MRQGMLWPDDGTYKITKQCALFILYKLAIIFGTHGSFRVFGSERLVLKIVIMIIFDSVALVFDVTKFLH